MLYGTIGFGRAIVLLWHDRLGWSAAAAIVGASGRSPLQDVGDRPGSRLIGCVVDRRGVGGSPAIAERPLALTRISSQGLQIMLDSLLWIILAGFLAGQIADRLKLPALVGMILAGILLGPQVSHRIDPQTLPVTSLRMIAIMVIMTKAGLGLDRAKLIQQGSVALRLGILPAACEALTIAVVAMGLFHFNFSTGLLLGLVISAESPAIIVPGMLQLKRLGWGTSKGIPDAILMGSTLSNIFVLLLFNLLITALASGENSRSPIFLFQIMGYVAVVVAGFWIATIAPPLAHRLRQGFDGLWRVAQIWLFVLLGASMPLHVLGAQFWPGLLILAIGTFVGRSIGWYLSTLGSNWNWRERLFLLPGNSAKATVQAAIGAMPLTQGIAGGETILAIAMWSILVTAPIGAWAIPRFAPKLLAQGETE
jgi:solute carrier family 9B (sodium/hydrogen exchanger), member 1/2